MGPYSLYPVQGQNYATHGDNAASGDKGEVGAREDEYMVLK